MTPSVSGPRVSDATNSAPTLSVPSRNARRRSNALKASQAERVIRLIPRNHRNHLGNLLSFYAPEFEYLCDFFIFITFCFFCFIGTQFSRLFGQYSRMVRQLGIQ